MLLLTFSGPGLGLGPSPPGHWSFSTWWSWSWMETRQTFPLVLPASLDAPGVIWTVGGAVTGYGSWRLTDAVRTRLFRSHNRCRWRNLADTPLGSPAQSSHLAHLAFLGHLKFRACPCLLVFLALVYKSSQLDSEGWDR